MYDQNKKYNGCISKIHEISFERAELKPWSDPYYMVKPIMKHVTKQEFDAFIRSYPRPLDRDVTGICDPPAISYNDFQIADRWPSSIVASTHAYDDDHEGYFYVPEAERMYYVMENYKEVFASKTGYTAPKPKTTQCGTVHIKSCGDNKEWSEPVFTMEYVSTANFEHPEDFENTDQ